MNDDEARAVLRIGPDVGLEGAKAARNKLVKKVHPDLNGAGDSDPIPLMRVLEAYRVISQSLKRRALTIWAPPLNGRAKSKPSFSSSAIFVVLDFLRRHQIDILFNGTPYRRAGMRMAENPAEISVRLEEDDIDFEWVMDTLMLEQRELSYSISKSDAERALRLISRRKRLRRQRIVMDPLYVPLSPQEQAAAELTWCRLAQSAFEGNPALIINSLKHFVWQVKSKALGRPITYHLMPVIYSSVQGSGKTTFVRRFLSPLADLVPAPVLLSDLADPRSGEIFRFFALIVDDMERIEPKHVPILKSVLTAEDFQRRRPGSHSTTSFRQRSTLIGTANEVVDRLIADDTGHRRFITLQFRNGMVVNEGFSEVWAVVNTIDFTPLWRSVDVFKPSPITSILEVLVAAQAADSPFRQLQDWLFSLNANSDDVLNLVTRHGMRAGDLHALFCRQTGSRVTPQWFGRQMSLLSRDERCPFGPQYHHPQGRYWPLRKRDRDREPS